jgi:hypothetical protein
MEVNMNIITIRGQMGSFSPEMGKSLAQELKMNYVDREIIASVAERLRKSEDEIIDKEMPPGSLLGHIAEALKHSYISGAGGPAIYLPTWEIPLDDSRYLEGLVSVITELASSGSVVIRGRGSQFILKDRPDAFHVLTVAPFTIRLKRVMESLKLDEESARKEINRDDSSRREFTKRYFKAELEDPVNYDLVINMGKLNVAAGVSIISHAIRLRKIAKTAIAA